MNDVNTNITLVCLNNIINNINIISSIKSINLMTLSPLVGERVLTDSLNHKTKNTEQISYHNKNIDYLW